MPVVPFATSLKATGSAVLSKPLTDTLALVQVSGDYTGLSFVIEGSFDSTNYFGLGAIKGDTLAILTGSISPTDASTQLWKVPCEMLGSIRARVTAISTNTATFTLASNVFHGLSFSVGSSSLSNSTFSSQVTTPAVQSPSGSNLALGSTGSYITLTFTDSITAFSTGGQTSATLLTSMVNRVVTVGAGNDSVKLPPTLASISIGPIVVTNAHASNSVNVFPSLGDKINAASTNAAFALAAGNTAMFTSAGTGQWHAVLTA